MFLVLDTNPIYVSLGPVVLMNCEAAILVPGSKIVVKYKLVYRPSVSLNLHGEEEKMPLSAQLGLESYV
jgi:hypothetical protein